MTKFWEIYDQLYQPVKKFIAAMIRDEWAAEDLVQEVFITVQEKWDALEDQTKAKSWVYAIARNQCLDYLRRVKLSREKETAASEGSGVLDVFPIQKRLEQREMSRCVQDKVDMLPEKYRSILILYDLMDMSHLEAADILDISVGAAKVRLHRARGAMKQILQTHCSLEMDERSVLVCEPKALGE